MAAKEDPPMWETGDLCYVSGYGKYLFVVTYVGAAHLISVKALDGVRALKVSSSNLTRPEHKVGQWARYCSDAKSYLKRIGRIDTRGIYFDAHLERIPDGKVIIENAGWSGPERWIPVKAPDQSQPTNTSPKAICGEIKPGDWVQSTTKGYRTCRRQVVAINKHVLHLYRKEENGVITREFASVHPKYWQRCDPPSCLTDDLGAAQELIDDLREQNSTLENEKAAAKQLFDAETERTKNLRTEITSRVNERLELLERKDKLFEENKRLRREKDEFLAEVRNLSENLIKERSKVESIQKTNSSRLSEIIKLRADLYLQQDECSRIKTELAESKRERERDRIFANAYLQELEKNLAENKTGRLKTVVM